MPICVKDYIKKDSIEIAEKSKKDSLQKKESHNSFRSVITRGYAHGFGKDRRISTTPVISLDQLNWNTAEGFNYKYGITYNKKINDDRSWTLAAKLRYGVSNQMLNGKITSTYRSGKTNKTIFAASAGRYVFQYNNEGPVNELLNTYYDLLYGRNYMKIYQAWFGNLRLNRNWINGLSLMADVRYQDRSYLPNTNLFSFVKKSTSFTENYPVEQLSAPENRYQALVASLKISYQPGRKYIKYPDRIVATHSDFPTFSLQYAKGLPLLGSDIDFDRWKVEMHDDMNLHLWGTFMYRLSAGGFIRNKSVYVTDYTHFNGNQIILASPYLNSFQLSSYYANSNTQHVYTTLHAEHHFYGLLTNKIPLFRALKWYLVGSSNAYYVNANNNYIEVAAGLENIGFKLFRIFRVDGVVGYSNMKNPVYGIRIGISSSALRVSLSNEED